MYLNRVEHENWEASTVKFVACDDFDIIENNKDGHGYGISTVRRVDGGGFVIDMYTRRLRIDETTDYQAWYSEAAEYGGTWEEVKSPREAILKHHTYWRQDGSREIITNFAYRPSVEMLTRLLLEGFEGDRIFISL